MLNLSNLDKEERKKIYNYLTDDDLRKNASKRKRGVDKVSLGVLKEIKLNINSAPIKVLTNYCEQNIDEGSVCEAVIVACFVEKIEAKFKPINALAKKMNKIEVGTEVSKEVLDFIESHRDTYNKLDMPLDYDTLIKALYAPNQKDEQIKELDRKVNDLESQLESLKKDLEETKKKEETFNQEITSYQETIQQQLNNINHLKDENEKMKEIMSIHHLKFKMSDLFEIENDWSIEEVYEKVIHEEELAMTHKDYERLRRLLALKYALVNMMEVNFNGK